MHIAIAYACALPSRGMLALLGRSIEECRITIGHIRSFRRPNRELNEMIKRAEVAPDGCQRFERLLVHFYFISPMSSGVYQSHSQRTTAMLVSIIRILFLVSLSLTAVQAYSSQNDTQAAASWQDQYNTYIFETLANRTSGCTYNKLQYRREW